MPDIQTLDPLVVQIIRRQKDDLLGAEKSTMLQLTGSWLNMESRLAGQMDSLALDLLASGNPVTLETLLSNQRFRTLAATANSELRGFLAAAGNTIADQQLFFGQLALSDSVESLGLGLAQYGRFAQIQQLSPDALARLVGLARNGESLASLLSPAQNEALAGMARYLIDAARSGATVPELIRAMQDGLAFGYNRVLTIARSESLGTYREMTRQQWAATGLVDRFMRVTAHDDRVCPGCLMAEGEIYTIDQPLAEHAQGRCAMLPIIINQPPPQWLAGAAWFETQSESTQMAILGPGRFNAWADGKFALADLVTRQTSDQWGESVVPTPLYQLLGES